MLLWTGVTKNISSEATEMHAFAYTSHFRFPIGLYFVRSFSDLVPDFHSSSISCIFRLLAITLALSVPPFSSNTILLPSNAQLFIFSRRSNHQAC